MPNTVLRHDSHDVVEIIVENTNDGILRHGVLNKGWTSGLFPRRGFVQADTVFPAYPEDVSLCDDADNLLTFSRYDQSADAVLI